METRLKGRYHEVDAEGKAPWELSEENDTDSFLEDQIDFARENGFDGVHFKNLDDAVNLYDRPSNHYAVFNPNQIKSADPFTFDEQGDLIPLDKRFQESSDDIRFSVDYRDQHRAPFNQNKELTTGEDRLEDGVDLNLVDIAQGYSVQPDDYFSPSVGARYYGYEDEAGQESYRAIREAFESIEEGENPWVNIYRSVPLDVEEGINNGDWVTMSHEYAVQHGESRFDGEYEIIEEQARADSLWWDGNDINEWGFDDGTGGNETSFSVTPEVSFDTLDVEKGENSIEGGKSYKVSGSHTGSDYSSMEELREIDSSETMATRNDDTLAHAEIINSVIPVTSISESGRSYSQYFSTAKGRIRVSDHLQTGFAQTQAAPQVVQDTPFAELEVINTPLTKDLIERWNKGEKVSFNNAKRVFSTGEKSFLENPKESLQKIINVGEEQVKNSSAGKQLREEGKREEAKPYSKSAGKLLKEYNRLYDAIPKEVKEVILGGENVSGHKETLPLIKKNAQSGEARAIELSQGSLEVTASEKGGVGN